MDWYYACAHLIGSSAGWYNLPLPPGFYCCITKTGRNRWRQRQLKASLYSQVTFVGRRQWHPTPVLLPGKSHEGRSLVGCSPWGREESDVTQQLLFHFSLSCFGEGNGNLLQCSCLENPRDGGACWAAVYGVTQSRAWLKWRSSNIHWSWRKQRNSRKTFTAVSSTMLKPLTVWNTTNWKILSEMEVLENLTYLLRNLCAGQEATVRTEHGTMTGSKLGKEYDKAVYCHPVYLTYVQSTSWKMLGWRNHKLESRSKPQICRWYHSNGRHWRGTKELLDDGVREWKSCLKMQHSKY